MFKRRKIEQLDSSKFVEIVADAGIGTGRVGEGRFVPVVIVDTTKRPDLVELVRLHGNGAAGDVRLNWASILETEGKVALVCKFVRPVVADCVIVFDVDKQGILVEQTLASRALYFQPGKPGDRLKSTWENPRIVMEIPEMPFRPAWDKIYFKSVVKQFRAKGFGRIEAKNGAKAVIEQLRGIGAVRMPVRE